MLSSDLEMKEEECYEMDSRDEQWGSFLCASHKLMWLKQAGGVTVVPRTLLAL